MKIGDKVHIRGYVDEIRQDIVIIRNGGGYFGTIPSEVIKQELEHEKIANYMAIKALQATEHDGCEGCKHI